MIAFHWNETFSCWRIYLYNLISIFQKSSLFVASNSWSPLVWSVAWPTIPCIMSSDPIMFVAVLGGPRAVRLPTPALLAAALSIVTDLVVELAALSSTRAVALGVISAGWERFVIWAQALTIGAFHQILGAGIEPHSGHGAISTGGWALTLAHWRGEICWPSCVLSSRSVVHGFATVRADWAGTIITEMAPTLG